MLQFSDTTNLNGIVELIDANCNTDSTSYPLKQKARDVNLAALKLLMLAIQASGKWQVDDYNHTKDPIITANLNSGQRDYHFTTDEQSNIILDIYRVMVANSNGVFYDLELVDQQSKDYRTIGMVDGQNITGQPSKYDITGNGIFLDAIPNYSVAGGIKIFINREHSYFVSTDTTKTLGFASAFHEYLALRPSYQYAYRKGLSNKKDLQTEMLLMEDKIEEYFSKRSKDEKTRIIPVFRSSR